MNRSFLLATVITLTGFQAKANVTCTATCETGRTEELSLVLNNSQENIDEFHRQCSACGAPGIFVNGGSYIHCRCAKIRENYEVANSQSWSSRYFADLELKSLCKSDPYHGPGSISRGLANNSTTCKIVED